MRDLGNVCLQVPAAILAPHLVPLSAVQDAPLVKDGAVTWECCGQI